MTVAALLQLPSEQDNGEMSHPAVRTVSRLTAEANCKLLSKCPELVLCIFIVSSIWFFFIIFGFFYILYYLAISIKMLKLMCLIFFMSWRQLVFLNSVPYALIFNQKSSPTVPLTLPSPTTKILELCAYI
jgi:hypothetical protein